MTNWIVESIGFGAAFLTTFALLPQVIKTYKTKSAADISFLWISSLTLGVLLWTIYGYLIDSLPLFTANVVTLLFSLLVFVMKLKYGGGNDSV